MVNCSQLVVDLWRWVCDGGSRSMAAKEGPERGRTSENRVRGWLKADVGKWLSERRGEVGEKWGKSRGRSFAWRLAQDS